MRVLLKSLVMIGFSLPLLVSARDWTVAVYMCADNDLAQFATRNLEEMKRVPFSDKVSIVVEVDRPYETAKRYLVEPGRLTLIEDLGEIDMCNPQEIVDFGQFVKQAYPADRYYVVMWDHGTGWVTGPRRSFGVDWTSNNTVGISDGELENAVGEFSQALGQKIDVLTFDACLMGMVEVACELTESVKFLLTSEHWVPIEGMPYEKILGILTSSPGIGADAFSRKMVDAYVAHYQGRYVNMSLVKIDEMGTLKNAVKDLITEFGVGKPPPFLKEIRQVVQTFSLESPGVPSPRDDYVDLGDYLGRLDVYVGSDRTRQAVESFNRAAIYTKYSGDSLAGSKGLSVWFPDEYIPSFKGLAKNYLGLVWSRGTGWERYLNWFYDADDVPPSETKLVLSPVGAKNDFKLFWSKSYDLAPVTYDILELTEPSVAYEDFMEDSAKWTLNGFSFGPGKTRSGSSALFSGTGNLLNNTATLKDSFFLANPVLITFFCSYDIQERRDSLVLELKDELGAWRPLRTIYGRDIGWQEFRVAAVPAGRQCFRFRYRTDSALVQPGAYIEDLRITELKGGRYAARGRSDTSYSFYNKKSGGYFFTIGPVDNYDNHGNYSQLGALKIENYATPYSVPNPFSDGCTIVLDFPDGLKPALEVYSITGRRVRSFKHEAISNKQVFWDGKSESGRKIGSGLYFLFLHAGDYKSLGRIAKVE